MYSHILVGEFVLPAELALHGDAVVPQQRAVRQLGVQQAVEVAHELQQRVRPRDLRTTTTSLPESASKLNAVLTLWLKSIDISHKVNTLILCSNFRETKSLPR